MKHLRTLNDLSPDDIVAILDRATELKAEYKAGHREPILPGRLLSMLFEKPSLRTRVSFEAAMSHLGGNSVFQSTDNAGLNGRESLPDVSRVLSGFSDVIVLRTFSQQLIEDFSVHSRCPIINGLSDDAHPCQALTDMLTIRETLGDLAGRRLTYIGDGNNVARSLCLAAALTGLSLTVCTPPDFAIPADFLDDVCQRYPDADITETTDPLKAVSQAELVYTDVWASMGQEAEAMARRAVFASYQVNATLMGQAPDGCYFMHDLPAHRGEEVTDEVIDGPCSLAFIQAENRMHLAKGLIAWLLD
ncbi:MAG: ornithine carbamoyltransferase [Planctomycetaceae bacterium]